MRTARPIDAVGLDPLGAPGRAGVDPDGRFTDGHYWLISHAGHGSTAPPVPRLTGGGSVLPVFSSGEEAAEFLRLRGDAGGWWVGAVGAGDLLAILLGSRCADVETVTLDPIPGVSETVSAHLVGVCADRFARHLSRRRIVRVA